MVANLVCFRTLGVIAIHVELAWVPGMGWLRYVDLDVSARGRGSAGRPRQAMIRLPLGAGPLLPQEQQARRHLRAV